MGGCWDIGNPFGVWEGDWVSSTQQWKTFNRLRMHAMYKVKRMASKDWDPLSQRSAVGNVLNILHSLSHNLIGTFCTLDLSNKLFSLSNAWKWREMRLIAQEITWSLGNPQQRLQHSFARGSFNANVVVFV